jgi:transcriptional regulator with XRE-family HTH domain
MPLTNGVHAYPYLAANLRRLRRERDLSQRALGVLADGLDQTYVSSLERGLRPWNDAHVDTLSRVLGVRRGELLAAPASVRATTR